MSEEREGVRRHPAQSRQHPPTAIASATTPHDADLAGAVDLVGPPSAASDPDFPFGDFDLPYPSATPDQPMIATPTDIPQATFLLQHPAVGAPSGLTPPVHVASAISRTSPLSGLNSEPSTTFAIDTTDDCVRDRDTSATSTPNNAGLPDQFNAESSGASHGPSEGADPLPADKAGGDGADAAQPAWSDLKTKAGKDRKRLPLACIACRRKKIRCSGDKPGCKHCSRSRIPCVYKVTARKAAPRTDYMAMLDKRLKRMEERIIKILPKSEQAVIAAVPRAIVKPAVPGAGASASTRTVLRKRNAADAFGPDPSTSARTPQPKTAGRSPDNADGQELEETKLLTEGLESLPAKDIQEHLAEVFFDHVYGQAYHLLHKPSYMRKLRSDALPPVLVLSVCAIAARFTTNPKLNTTAKHFMRGEEWASVARGICISRYDWPNITILTCLLILGLHEFSTCHGGRSWALGGQAIRMAFALHLHKDLEYDPHARGSARVKLSFVDREIRRRTMWACFIMDRFNSSGTDRPIFIREETMRIPLPVSERYFQLDMPTCAEYLDGGLPGQDVSSKDDAAAQPRPSKDSMGVSAYTIRSISIWGRIITYINQGGKDVDAHPMWSSESEFARLVQETEKLLRTLPEAIKYSRQTLSIHRTQKTACHLLFLHMSIQQNLLFLSQAAVTFSQDRFGRSAPKDFVLQSSAKTFFAANQISDLIRDAEEAQCSISTPFAGYCAFSSTAIHITGLFSGNPAMKSTSEANSKINVRFLSRMMKYWGMFHWMVENIRTQYRNALDSAQSGGAAHGAAPSSPILQYSDWFNRYPHGVSDPDYMDPAIYRKKEMGEDGALEQKSGLQTVGEFFTAIESAQSLASKDGPRGPPPKRKATKKQVNAAAGSSSSSSSSSNATKPPADNKGDQPQKQEQRHDDRSPATSLSDQGALPLQLQYQDQQQQPPAPFQRGLSAVGETAGGLLNFNPDLVPQSQAPSQPIALVPDMLLPRAHPMSLEPGFFTTDMLSMNLGRPPDSLLQSLDRQFTYGGYLFDPLAISPAGMLGGWNDGLPQQLSGLDGLDAAQGMPSAWLAPLEEGPEMTPCDDVNPFGDMFAGTGQMASIDQNNG